MAALYLAEKPSLARAIAESLGKPALQRDPATGSGYYEISGSDIKVSWNYGHMLEQAPPGAYRSEWAKWHVRNLPYQLADSEWKLQRRAGAEAQLAVIERLLKEAKTVIHAGDPGREGQLIVDSLLNEFGWRGPTLRIKPTAVDQVSMKKILARQEDNAKYRNLYIAALCRQRADWLVGMNLTVAATKLLANDVKVPVGRVQTPTLALVVRRDLEIGQFSAKTFYRLMADVATGQGQCLTLTHNPGDEMRITDPAIANALVQRLQGSQQVLAVTQVKKKELSPLPFSLPTFQKAAEAALGLGAQESLETLQKLYDAKYVTYPRSDCQYLPAEQKTDAGRIVRALLGHGFPAIRPLASVMSPKDRVYDTSKTGEHHGIVPTGQIPSGLTPALMAAWNLVATQFLLSLLPDYEYEETVVSFEFDGRKFSAKGEVPLNLDKSWRAAAPKASDEAAAQTVLPAVLDGEQATVTTASAKEGKTTPPAHYTEASLIADMTSVAKYVSNPKLKEILKNKENPGIGTVATHASIIERLKESGMIEPKGKRIIATQFGRDVIAAMPPSLCDPGVTAAWEDALDRISKGEYPASEFMQRIDAFIARRIDDMRQSAIRILSRPPEHSAIHKTGTTRGKTLASKSGTRKPPTTKAGTTTKRASPARPGSSPAGAFLGGQQ